MSPLNADYRYEDASEIPEVTIEEFEQFNTIMSAMLGNRRSEAFCSVLLWVRCGLPSRLYAMGLDQESAMVYAQSLLEIMVQQVAGYTLPQIQVAVPYAVRNNATPLLLSTSLLEFLADVCDCIGALIEALTFPSEDLTPHWSVIEQASRSAAAMYDGEELFTTHAVERAVNAHWCKI